MPRKNLGAIISALATLIYYKVVIYISSYVATVRCFTLHIFVNAGMKMKQSVICLNVIDQHYLNFHLPQKEILLLLLLILYLFNFSRHCEHKIKNTANSRVSDPGFIWNLLSGSEKVANTSLFLV